MKKRVLSLFLCVLMVVSSLTFSLQSANAESTTVYSLASDSDIQGKDAGTIFQGTTWLQQSGSPTLTIVANGGVAKSINVTGRRNDYDAIDLKNLATLPDGFEYTVKVTGRTGQGAKMKMSQPGSPYGTHVSQDVGVDMTFSLEKTFSYAALQTDKSIRIQSEGTMMNDFTIDNIVITQTPVSGGGTPPPSDGKTISDIAITFNDADKAQWSGSFSVSNTTNASVEWVSDFGNGDTYSLKGTHLLTSADYTGGNNAIRLTFAEPLAKNAIYNISYSVYVPAAGNEGKDTLVGPGIVLSGDYAGSAGVTKFPTDPGTIATGTWKEVNVTTPAGGLNETLKNIDFRFVVNEALKHPDVWYIDNISIKQQLISVETVQPDYKDYPALKDVYKDYFMIGTTSGNSRMTGDKLDIIKYHFNAFTPENEMKPSSVQNVKGTFTYSALDDQFGKLKDTGINLIGHTLAWHSQTPTWMWGSPNPLTADEAKANMDAHIASVLGRYGSGLYSIDVVNEAFADGKNNADWRLNLRNSEGWYLALGPEWVEYAFVKAAQIVDANGWNCKLYYNDYNLDNADKAKAVYNMVKDINERYAGKRPNGKPLIEGIGMQGHYNQNTVAANVENSINLFSTLPGVAISVTELDITYSNSGSLTEEQAKSQAVKYAQLFDIYKKNAAGPANGGKGRIERVTFWGTNDADSWRAASFPLLFDRNLRAKEAFKAVLDPAKYLSENKPPQEIPKAKSVNGTPTLGTNDAAWKKAAVINVDKKPTGQAVQAGATAVVKTLWDASFLYVRAEVTDSKLDKTSVNPWEQDSVEVFFSETAHRKASYADGDGQYRVNFEGGSSFKSDTMANGFSSWAAVTDTGYVVEMKIPFRVIQPKGGTAVSFDVQLNDVSDGASTRLLTVWSDLTANGYNTTELWGTLTLAQPTDGVHVYAFSNGDSYSGANIILGNNASVWPWSMAGADGKVAFTPEKDATYRISFNYTSMGTNAIRVRWIRDESNGGYTTQDGSVVGASPSLDPSQVATSIPVYFNKGMATGNSYTLVTEVKLDGSQPAEGLIGNIAIRGGAGGNNFFINWIKVEKIGTGGATDKLLVNWPEGIDESVPEEPGIPPAGKTYEAYPALKDVYKDYFTMGIFGAGENNALIHNFAAYAPGNEMKPESTQNVKGTFTYSSTDNAFNNLLSRNPNMLFYGHTLAWHSQTPTWMWDAPPARYGQPGTFDRATALANLNNHIENVLGYFGGRLKGIDVVNEAIGTANPSDWKASLAKGEGWYMALGWEWVELAFLKAAEVVDSHPDWDCKLIYNDFGLDSPNKAQAVYKMVKDINERYAVTHPRPNGKPLIEVIGMQEHDNLTTKASDVENSIKLFATLPGVKINITEMDIGCPPVGALTPENENNQAMKYAELFQIFRNYATGPANKTNNPKVIDRVSICGVRDATSGWRAGEFALLFNSNGLAKQALVAVLDPSAYLATHNYIEPEPEPEITPVDGVHVYDAGKGDAWSGANIILGNNANAWPWSTAGADGKVAFTPEKDATYRLTFNYTSKGTSAIRVRWVKDDSNSGYTTADGAVVNKYLYSADKVAITIPAYFNSGMAANNSYTLTDEIKLDGSQPAEGLIGNIAIRGGAGGNAFTINSLKIEKLGADGNVTLTEWPAPAPTGYTATANGAANTTNSNSIALVFEKPVPGLAAADIDLTAGTAGATKGTLTAVPGSNNTKYDLAISGVTIEGNVNLRITKSGVDDKVKAVDVHQGPITAYTATANGTANTADSSTIALVFEKSVPGLTAADIAITAGTASATKSAYNPLTAVAGSNNTQYNLAITGVTVEGNINLNITKAGVDNAAKIVYVHRGLNVTNIGGTAFVRESTGIRLSLNIAVPDLSADDIILSPGTPTVSMYAAAMAQKGALTKVSDTVYELALTGITQTGMLGVKVNKAGVDPNQKSVLVNAKVNKTALQPTPPRNYFPQNITNLPKSAGLPDLFQFLDPTAGTNGRVETKADWQERRDELKDLIQYYYYGRKYPTPKSAIMVNTQTNQVNVTITDNGSTVTASLGNVIVPSGTAPEGGWPVIIAFGFGQTAMATQNGYAVISVSNWGGSRTGNYYKLYPFNPYEYDFNTGSIMTAAWSVSRIIDAMEISAEANGGMNQWNINPYKSITTGVSINGKYALMAAAMDDRVGAAAPVDCGQSGASSFRYIAEGKLFFYNSPIDRVFRRNQKGLNSIQYSGESFWMGLGTAAGFHLQTDMDYLPFDAHAVEALMAPRPLIAFTADNNFDWTTPPSSIMAMSAAKEVYDFLGSDNIAVRTRDGAHAIQDRDVPFMIAIMDKEFSGKPLEVRNLYPNSNPPSYGTGTYNKISDMTIYPYDIDSSYIRWSRPGKYTLWTENEIITEGIPATIKVHSDAQQVKLTILDADNKPTDFTWTANVVSGTAVFNLKAEQVKIGRYEITTVGSAKDSKTVYFQGVDIATALRHGTAQNDNGKSVMYGFTSKINKDMVEVYADGNKLTKSLQEDAEQAWILNYGVTTNPNENNRILNNAFNVATLKKLQMEAMPGYTFEISIDKSKLPSNQETVIWNASAAVQKIGPQPSWPPYPNSLTDDGTRPLRPATTTNFSADIDFSLNDLVDLVPGSKLNITFSEAMNSGDFGVGFDFSDDFSLAWAEDNKSVEVTFNDITKGKGEVCNIYIMRLRDAAGNMIAAPIHHSFIRMPIPVSTPTASVRKLIGDKNELTITVTDVYTVSVKKTYTVTFTINNNAAGTYKVGPYKVYVDTKGNTQVRECYIVK